MKLSHPTYRRTLNICAAIIAAVALILVLGVIGPVKAEVARGGTPQMALNAFWANIGLSLLLVISLLLVAARSKGRSGISTSIHIVGGLIVAMLGLALADAASAYQSHGPSMQTASTLLFICAAADVLTGILVFIAAFLQPEKP
jgi:hypothetical protein